MARPSNKAERRKQIAKGLMKVMAKRGYDGASIAEIAAAADLTTGLIHYHFKNKQEVLLAVLEGLIRTHDDELGKRLLDKPQDTIEQLKAFIDFHLGLGSDANPEALGAWLVLSGEALRQQVVREAFERAITKYVNLLHSIIEKGVEAGKMECADPKAAASALMATIQGYFVLAATARNQIPRGSAAKCTKEMAQGLVRPVEPVI